METQLLGFDVRLQGSIYADARWTQERRQDLLKPEIAWPLSVDRAAWPSYFVNPDWVGRLDPLVADRAVIVRLDEPRYLALHLWSDLGRMLEHYALHKRDPGTSGTAIAVRLEHAQSVPHQHWTAVSDPPVRPRQPVPQWPFLGYDVADQHLRSALVGFELIHAEIAGLRTTWGVRLNEHGLFTNRDDATGYLPHADQRWSEYRPFCIYSLYRIPI